jgi:uncharacterized repeat protein (TIGR02059 family)
MNNYVVLKIKLVKVNNRLVKNLKSMKKIFILIFITFSVMASATSYYISPTGNDSNSGTATSPFFTLNKAWSLVKAGDIIYAKGGVYRYNTRQNLIGKSGTATDTIRIMASPGERPVFTKSSSFVTSGWPTTLIYVSADYIHIKGIEIAYFKQATSAIWYGLAALGSDHCKFEQINSHHNGHGLVLRDESNHNLILNCDFHNNYDPLTEGDAYGNADGLEVGYMSGSCENTIRGCRIWNNSDDGIDLWSNNGNVVIDNCWSWNNGFREDGYTRGGDGGGFKFGATTTATGTEFKRTVKNCVSAFNRTRGYNQNSAKVKHYLYNNISYKNPEGIVFATDNLANVFRNNIVFSSSNQNWTGNFSNSIKDHNSYDPTISPNGPSVSSADFVSLDSTGLSKARQSNGALPTLNFLKLAAGSDLIDAGINVGIPYNGAAPDLGPFEYGASTTTTPPPVVTQLLYVSSSVKAATPSQIDVLYNVTLSTVLPATSSFEVKVNSVIKTVSKLAIADKTVSITLTEPVKYGDVVTFSYTKPATNPLQSTAGSIAANITGQEVTNSIVAGAAPVYVSSAVQDGSPDKIEITYDIKLASVIPALTSFTAKVNRQVRAVQSILIADNKVVLTLSSSIYQKDTVTVSYIRPAINPLQSTLGGIAASLAEKTVTNNVKGVVQSDHKVLNNGKTFIWPNPATDYVNVSNVTAGAEEPVLKIFNIEGKQVQEVKLTNLSSTVKVPIHLASGIYVTQVCVGKVAQYVQKLIVVK